MKANGSDFFRMPAGKKMFVHLKQNNHLPLDASEELPGMTRSVERVSSPRTGTTTPRSTTRLLSLIVDYAGTTKPIKKMKTV
jgi:hypothetical protein